MKIFYQTLLFVFISCFLLPSAVSRDLESIRKSGKIYVAFTGDDLENINYPLALELAKYLNVDLEIVEIEWDEAFSQNGIIPNGLHTDPAIRYTPDALLKADIISSTFTVLEWRKKLFDFASTMISTEVLVVSKNGQEFTSPSQLKGLTISYMGSTSYEDHIKAINDRIGGGIILDENASNDEAKEKLRQGHTDGIILDADEALYFISREPQFTIAMPVTTPTYVAWVVEKKNPLRDEVEDFFQTIENNGVLDSLFFEYFNMHYSEYTQKIDPHQRAVLRNGDLDDIIKDGSIVMALRERDYVYRETGKKQLMHTLAEEFAWYLGLEADFVLTQAFSNYFEDSLGIINRDSIYCPEWFQHFDVACDVLSPDPWRESVIDLVEIFPVNTVVVAAKKTSIRRQKDLKKLRAVTTKGSIYEKLIENIGVKNVIYRETKNLLPAIDSGLADFTILDEPFFSLKDYPDFEKKISLGKSSINWAVKKDKPKMKQALMSFLRSAKSNGLLDLLIEIQNDAGQGLAGDLLAAFHNARQKGEFPYEFYTSRNQLPYENVGCVFQDNRGYLWLGTEHGLVRYNGRKMEVLSADSIQNKVLKISKYKSFILALLQDKLVVLNESADVQHIMPLNNAQSMFTAVNGNIYIQEEQGIGRFLEKEGTFYIEPLEMGIHAAPALFATDSATHFFYGIEDGQLFVYNLDKQELHQTKIPADFIYVSKNDELYLFHNGNCRISNANDYLGAQSDVQNISGFPNKIRAIEPSGDVGFWMMTDDALIRQQSPEKRGIKLDRKNGLQHANLNAMMQDREGNLWVAYSGGLQKILLNSGLRLFEKDLFSSVVYQVFQDDEKYYWVLSNQGTYRIMNNGKTENNKFSTKNYKRGGTADKEMIFLQTDDELLLVHPATRKRLSIKANSNQKYTASAYTPTTGLILSICANDTTALYQVQDDGALQYIASLGQVQSLKMRSSGDRIYLITDKELYQYSVFSLEKFKSTELKINDIIKAEGRVFAATAAGLFELFRDGSSEVVFPTEYAMIDLCKGRNQNQIWLATANGIYQYNMKMNLIENEIHAEDGLPADETSPDGLFMDNKGVLWIATYHGIANYSAKAGDHTMYAPVCFIDKIEINGSVSNIQENQRLNHNQNNLSIELTALSYSDETAVEYEFYLRGMSNDYQSYSKGSNYLALFNNLPPGHYEFVYKARGKDKLWGYAKTLNFSIQKPYWQSWLFRIAVFIAVLSLFLLIYKWRVRRLQKQKILLERLVKERTQQLEESNEELAAQRDLLSVQNDEIMKQKDEIENKNRNITDSIRYAKRIQEAILPHDKLVQRTLDASFILYKPKDIVSGDFYWMHPLGQRILYAAVDCTGHGVPGAFVSLVGHTSLNRTVKEFGITRPSEILDKLNELVLETFRQQGSEEVKDGMDMALCLIDIQNRRLEYAGANNPLYLIREGKLIEVKGTKKAIGSSERTINFENHEMELQTGDSIYIFSDGYVDQFGGPRNKKFLSRNFKKLLLSIQEKPMAEQRDILNQSIEDWQGDYEQIDDILVIGYRI